MRTKPRIMLMSWPWLIGLMMALSGCGAPAPGAAPQGSAAEAPATSVAASDPAPRNRCSAQAAQFLVGQPYGAATLEQARTAAGADEVRMLRPNSIVTKEYKLGRLNVVVDADQRVVRVDCS
jgi:hypothetical protein